MIAALAVLLPFVGVVVYSALFAQNGEWIGSTGSFKGPVEIKSAMEKAFPAPPFGTPAATGKESPSFHLLTSAIIDLIERRQARNGRSYD